MSNSATIETKAPRAQTRSPAKKPRSEAARSAKVAKKSVNPRSLEDWLQNQNFPVNPSVKVNGPSVEASIITVDFGSPIGGPVRLSPDQSAELTSRLKKLVGEMYVGDVHVRVSYDQQNGVYWASLG